MSDFMLDDTGDLDLQGGDIPFTEGVDRVRQYLAQRLQAFQGEWFLDLDAVVPYWTEVFRKNPDPVVLDGVFKNVIISTPGVTSLDEFNLTLDTRTRELRLQFRAQSADGEINFNQPVGAI